ncbi:MAG TPA: pyruvate, phosphate dikinase [Thermomicrobiales bacterium]|nr:pyruvate, phosphate dikinase [Thermomicrobiales bacterium]
MIATTVAQQWVYGFTAGDSQRRDLLGGKGAGLAEMAQAGLPVPPGFTITTEACTAYYQDGGDMPAGLWEQVLAALQRVEQARGKRFGDVANPLLLSVRSGAKVSMPGMMDTILDLGLTDATVAGLAASSGSVRFAYDSYRRLMQLYGKVVLGIPGELFEAALTRAKARRGVQDDTELDAAALCKLTATFKAIVREQTGHDFPQDPMAQLHGAIGAVFASWNTERAVNYRRENHIANDLGTAVNVQAMVYGNMGDDCATGVAFTRDPATGEKRLVGEYLPNAQGEDVVAGVRTPRPIAEMAGDPLLAPTYAQFLRVAEQLERHYRDAQDLEFTVEHGTLYMLQTRTAKRTGAAAVRMAVEMAEEGLIDRATAVRRVEPEQLDQLLHPTLDPLATPTILTTGLPASPGAASGQVVFNADEAEARQRAGAAVILVREETSPDDFHGMVAARGFVTARGGITSHAAVVARGMGKPCVASAAGLVVDYATQTFTVAETVVRHDDWITIDGGSGRVMLGQAPMIRPALGGELQTLLGWADEFRTLGVRANADTPHDAGVARDFGAAGIGLCRTEHMFFEGDRILPMRAMILAETAEERAAALARLLPLQRADFAGIFRAMDGLPVTIRTLDPPLHEFLPQTDVEQAELARTLGVDPAVVATKVEQLREANPMLGFRGCRLGIVYPEITAMQARAIFEAACAVAREGVAVAPEVMIPLVCTVKEMEAQRAIIEQTAREVFAEQGVTVPYLVGTMIELPRAALLADELAAAAEFFSFGTNDLTQTTFGLSRDDAGRFLPGYVARGILPYDPFQSLDQAGVGRLITLGTELGRRTRPGLKVGICGEHGGDPASVRFCAQAGLDYVSASPYRVPLARLAAAHAHLEALERADGQAGQERDR